MLEDVAVGEVWIAAGQSNMEFWMRYEMHRKEEKALPVNPGIRFFDVPKLAYQGQEEQFDYSQVGLWRKAGPEDLDWFSAVGYFFAKDLSAALEIPVGILGCTWGGTASCSWMSPESVRRTGLPWWESRMAPFAGRDLEEYRRQARFNPANDSGRPFSNPLNEFILPRTPSAAEIEAFQAAHPADPVWAGVPAPQSIPGSLYQHMVKSIAPCSVRGVLWYQGESDEELGQQELYRDMLTALIADWRRLWNSSSLPFLIVQLPGFESWFGYAEQGFPVLRRCQQLVADAGENLYLCSISDAGERWDLHPKDKRTVGHRLALLALGHIYGWNLLCDAPRLESVSRRGREVDLVFAHAEGGLEIRGGALQAMRVHSAGAEVPFDARTEGEHLRLTLAEEAGPVAMDFAQTPWYQVNLCNRSGIPALPFTAVC